MVLFGILQLDIFWLKCSLLNWFIKFSRPSPWSSLKFILLQGDNITHVSNCTPAALEQGRFKEHGAAPELTGNNSIRLKLKARRRTLDRHSTAEQPRPASVPIFTCCVCVRYVDFLFCVKCLRVRLIGCLDVWMSENYPWHTFPLLPLQWCC